MHSVMPKIETVKVWQTFNILQPINPMAHPKQNTHKKTPSRRIQEKKHPYAEFINCKRSRTKTEQNSPQNKRIPLGRIHPQAECTKKNKKKQKTLTLRHLWDGYRHRRSSLKFPSACLPHAGSPPRGLDISFSWAQGKPDLPISKRGDRTIIELLENLDRRNYTSSEVQRLSSLKTCF